MPRFRLISTEALSVAARSEWNRLIAWIAARQHGVVALRQLIAIGMKPSTVRYRVAVHQLVPVFRGVYGVAMAPLGIHGRWMAAVLTSGPGAWLSHAAAGALWEIRPSAATRIDVTSRHRRGRGQDGIRAHGADTIDPQDVTERTGIPCTTVERTIIDLSGMLHPSAVEYAIHRAQVRDLLDVAALEAAIERHPSRPGTRCLRSILGMETAAERRTKSRGEVRLLRRCVAAGLPEPLVNEFVALPDGDGHEVDRCWPGVRLVVELDSRRFRDDLRGFETDRRRDRELKLAGWTVLRFTERDLSDRPEEVVATVRRMLVLLGRSANLARR
jgi:Transcriptional regulator, AbiEi antitoxin/Protein of unknown function (DUF559)